MATHKRSRRPSSKPSSRNNAREKLIYLFGGGRADGRASMKDLLGGKGANLAEMAALGLPVPPGFTITTDVCDRFHRGGGKLPPRLGPEVRRALASIEKEMGRRFGDPEAPLLLSVRSGSAVSMPGMMDTVLNLGLNEKTVQGLIAMTGQPRFAFDSFRRFIQMYGDVVKGVDPGVFERCLVHIKRRAGDLTGVPGAASIHAEELHRLIPDTALDADLLRELVNDYLEAYRTATHGGFPSDPYVQLDEAIRAVFRSWNNERAIKYRRLNRVTGLRGTAVNVQAMVFGNLGDDCATGVCFSRNPSTGENKFYGEFLLNAQGEDVVAGVRTPKRLSTMAAAFPKAYKELVAIRGRLERHYRDMQDMEFTIEKGKLYMLQTRTGKRTAAAAVRIAIEMVQEKMIKKRDALLRIAPSTLDQLLHDVFDEKAVAQAKVLAAGLPASPGAATGRVVFDAATAENWAARGEAVILVRIETSPEDIGGMSAARGILTARGGMTSHAAVVARGMGKCCVAGSAALIIDYDQRRLRVGERVIEEGDWLSLDGSTGRVYTGRLETRHPTLSKDFATLMGWADKTRRLRVRANADTPEDARVAVSFGAQGIGLCRTEHMFFGPGRVVQMRRMILAEDRESRVAALRELLPMQRRDFEGLFREMRGFPVTIRLLDPPLHEFLPHDAKGQEEVAAELGVSPARVAQRVAELHEMNPMLGHRGCRLAISFPEIARMQARAILEAAVAVKKKRIEIHPEIMIPLVGHVREFQILAKEVRAAADQVFRRAGTRVPYLLGTMIEVPRAAVTADEIAEHAEFFSFGTNDLTQMGSGFSRDDSNSFLPLYTSEEAGIYKASPFEVLDTDGIGRLVTLAVDLGRRSRKNLKCGVCGEHGGDPESVSFFNDAGLDYVSCSPYRVPIARLAAAQAALRHSPKRCVWIDG